VREVEIGDLVYVEPNILVGRVAKVGEKSAKVELYARSGVQLEGILSNTHVELEGIGNLTYRIVVPKGFDVEIGQIIRSREVDFNVIAVIERGVLKQIGQTDYAGATLTNAVARVLGVSARRAEELKRRRGLLGFGGEYELSTSLLPFLDVIIRECIRVKDLYESDYQKSVAGFTLVGGGANLPGIGDYFTKQLQLPLSEPGSLRHFAYGENLEPLAKSLGRDLAVASGLTLKSKLS